MNFTKDVKLLPTCILGLRFSQPKSPPCVLLGINRYIVFDGEKSYRILLLENETNLTVVLQKTFKYRQWSRNHYCMIINQDVFHMICLFVAPMILQLILSIRLGATLYAAGKVSKSSNMLVNEAYCTVHPAEPIVNESISTKF